VLKSDAFEYFEIVEEQFVIGEKDLEFGHAGRDYVSRFSGVQMVELVLTNDFAHCSLSLIVVEQTVEVGPLFNLATPLLQSGEGSQY